MKKTVVTVISEIVDASDEGLNSVAIYTALKKRMRDNVPSYRTFKRRRSGRLRAPAQQDSRDRRLRVQPTGDCPFPYGNNAKKPYNFN